VALKKASKETTTKPNQTRGSPETQALYNKRDSKKGWGKKYNVQEALNSAIQEIDADLWEAFNKEFDNAVEKKNAYTPITNAIIAVMQDVRQDTITPMQGAKLLPEAYATNGVKGLESIYNHSTGNLYNRYLEKAKQYDTVPKGKASQELGEYTEEQYNDFGWVRANDVINEGYWDNFTRNYADAVNSKDFNRISSNGEYMIEIYDEILPEKEQTIDHIVFAKGDI
jgi:hypothetical protein